MLSHNKERELKGRNKKKTNIRFVPTLDGYQQGKVKSIGSFLGLLSKEERPFHLIFG